VFQWVRLIATNMHLSLQPLRVYRAHIDGPPLRSQPRAIAGMLSDQEFCDRSPEPRTLDPIRSCQARPIWPWVTSQISWFMIQGAIWDMDPFLRLGFCLRLGSTQHGHAPSNPDASTAHREPWFLIPDAWFRSPEAPTESCARFCRPTNSRSEWGAGFKSTIRVPLFRIHYSGCSNQYKLTNIQLYATGIVLFFLGNEVCIYVCL